MSAVFAVAMCKDEADIIEGTVRRMRERVDHVVVADNGSTDGTREILDSLDGVEVLVDHDPGYYQSRKMSALAEHARLAGADWVVPFDADEVWLGREWSISDTLAAVPAEALIAQARILDHVATAVDPDGPPIERMRWRRDQQLPLPKVACRAVPGLVIHQGNHGATFPGVDCPLTVTHLLEIRHYPYRSPEQMVRKAVNGAAAYAATDLPESAGGHWRGYGAIVRDQGEEALHGVFRKWFWSPDPAADPHLVHDPCPA